MTQQPPRKPHRISFGSVRAIAQKVAQRLLAVAVTPWGRLLLLGVFLVVLGWLMYSAVWQQLAAPAPLPIGVSEQNPRLNTGAIRDIATRRLERIGMPAIDTAPAADVIRAPVVPTPAL